MKKIFIFLTLITSFSISAQTDRYWSGGGGDDDLRTNANWWSGNVPTNTDHLKFNNTITNGKTWMFVPGIEGNGYPFYFNSIVSYNGGQAMTIVGQNTYTLWLENYNNPHLLRIGSGTKASTDYGYMNTFGSRINEDLTIAANGSGGVEINSEFISIDDRNQSDGTHRLILKGSNHYSVVINGVIKVPVAGQLGDVEVQPNVTVYFRQPNQYRGHTFINGGVIYFEADDVLPPGNTDKTIRFGGSNTDSRILYFGNYNQNALSGSGQLDFDANTTFNLGSSGTVRFNDSDSQTWDASQITINNWTGSYGETGTGQKIFVGNHSAALTSAQLDKITFTGFGKAALLPNGELVPRDFTTRISASWDNGDPSLLLRAVVAEDYTTSADIVAKALTINNAVTLTIGENQVFTTGNFVNNGLLKVKNDANFIQTEGSINSGSGQAEVSRQSNVSVDRNQYTLWSSPVAGQKVYQFYASGQPVPYNRAFTYNTSDDFYSIVPAGSNFAAGIGYAIKEPALGNAHAKFSGTIHNGDFSVTLDHTSGTAPYYNMVGNPYPSNLDLDELFSEEGVNADSYDPLDAYVYLWDKTGNTILVQQGSAYEGDNFAIYHLLLGIGQPAGGSHGLGETPTSLVKTGQGFILAAGNSNLTFKNLHRASGHSHFFTKHNKKTTDYFRLLLKPASGYYKSIFIGYHPKAKHTEDPYDLPLINESTSDQFFTFADQSTSKLTMQGRQNLPQKDEKIKMGIKSFALGTQTIEIYDENGVFANGWTVYLKDHLTGTLTDLSQTRRYSFEAVAGESPQRFSLVYQPEATLQISTSTNRQEVLIYRNQEDFTIQAKDNILKVEFYNLAGQLVFTTNDLAQLSKEIHIRHATLLPGVYIAKVFVDGGVISRKIMK